MNTQTRIARIVALVVLVFISMSTAPAWATTEAPSTLPGHVKLQAKLLDSTVKVHGKARIQGKLEVESPFAASSRALELVVVQQLQAGVWVDVNTGYCRPNLTFKLSVSFSLAAQYSLRLYHPETVVYASAYSEVFVLAVIP